MKVVRIKTWSGEVRLCGMGQHTSLPSWWNEVRSVGAVIGENYCMSYESIEIADMIMHPDLSTEAPVRSVVNWAKVPEV